MVLGGSFLVYMIDAPLDHSTQSGLFLVILLIAGTILLSTIFSDLGDKKKAIAYLTLPASHFEKYLVAWLYSFLVFLVICAVSFFVAEIVPAECKTRSRPCRGCESIYCKNSILQFGLIYAFPHAIAFWGAIYF